jgi:quercetin dioxygenase-like cupin family protein
MARRVNLFRWEDRPLDKITEMVSQKTIASAHATLTQAYFKKGAVVPRHVHARDVTIHVLQGALRVRTDGEDDVTVREGEVLVVSAGAVYETESLDDTFLLAVRVVE